jgi:protocatechuate 3,4-dioxygenase beta subunit
MQLTRRILVALVLVGAVGWFVAQYLLGPPGDLEPPQLLDLDARPGPSEVDPGRTLRGAVLDHTGKTVAGALVWTEGALEATSWDLTDGDGRFLLSHLKEGEVDVRFAGATIPHGRLAVAVPASAPVELNLPAPTASPDALPEVERSDLSGQVRLPDEQSPAGLEVLLLPIGRDPRTGMDTVGVADLDGRVPRRATCDADGLFRFEGAAQGSYLAAVLPAWAAGRSRPRLAERPIEHGAEAIDHILNPSSGSLGGQVLNADGEPVDGAVVLLWPASDPTELWPTVESDAEGRYRFSPLPEGSYRVRASAGSGVSEQLVRVAALREAHVDLRWSAKPGS